MASFYTQIREKAGEMAPFRGVLQKKRSNRDRFDCERKPSLNREQDEKCRSAVDSG